MRAPVTLLLLLVLALRSLLPTGFMVQASDASGTIEIVVCTSAGQTLMTISADGTTPQQKPQHVESGLCPFAAAGAAALAAAEPRSLAGEAEYAAITFTLAAAQFSATPKPGATSARGPPSQLI